MVLIDPSVLNSLSDHFLKDGMGEVIKYGCIKDASLFKKLESFTSYDDLKTELTDIIARCVDIKREVVEHDQFDKGERMLLNFGHTLAHTIEPVSYTHLDVYKRQAESGSSEPPEPIHLQPAGSV